MNLTNQVRAYLFSALILLVVHACSPQDASDSQTVDETGIPTVEVVHPAYRSIETDIQITGSAEPNQKVLVYPMESGMLSSISVDIGDEVSKGEILAILSNPELLHLSQKLKAELKSKQSIFERLNSVYKESPALTTIQSVEKAQADFEIAQAELSVLEDRIGFLSVKAPFSGTITKRFVDVGSMLQNGMSESNPQAIVEIQQLSPIRVILPVPESDAVSIKKSDSVLISFPEMSGETFMAQISRTSGSLDAKSKTMQVEIDLPNKDNKIVVGMYAKALIQMDGRSNILTLESQSKIRYKNEDYVLAVVDNVVIRVPVKVGLSNSEYFEVLNGDISSESTIVLTGKSSITTGSKVETRLNTPE